jgi:large subunit ribosomal protein L4
MTGMNILEASAYTAQGTERDKVPLPDAIFDGTVNSAAMHQVVKAYLANQRQGTHATKTRGLVTGGNQKPWRQKGTGRARQGSIRAPNWVGGGTVFGPIPRSYRQVVPHKLKQLARKSALNARARENALFVIDAFNFEAPRTSRLRVLLSRLELDRRNVLVLTDGIKKNVYLSGRNLPNVQVMPFDDVSTYHVLWSHAVLVEGSALGHRLEPIAEREPASRPKRAKRPERKSEDESAAPVKKRAKTTSRATAKKATARKSPARKSAARRGTAKKSPARKTAGKRATGKRAAGKRAAGKPRRKEK